MQVSIISPTQTLFSGNATAVTLPSQEGEFTALDNHAPIVAILEKGEITIQPQKDGEDVKIKIESGFVEIHESVLTACVETV